MNLKLVPRRDWKAVDPQATYPLEIPVDNVFTTYSYSAECNDKASCLRSVQLLQERQMNLGSWPDIRYNFVIGGDGRVYEGRGWNCRPDLPNDCRKNTKSIYVAYVGTYKYSDVSTAMKKACEELIAYGVDNFYIHKKYNRKHLHSPKAKILTPLPQHESVSSENQEE